MSMLLDIVILPPAKIRDKIEKAITKSVAGIAHGFVVDNRKLIPHLSLFHIRTSAQRLPKLYTVLEDILTRYKPLAISKSGFYGFGPYACFETNNPAKLGQLHREVVFRCHNLRTGAMPSTTKKLTTWDREYFRKYGSRHLLGNFRPHFTLAQLRNEKDIDKLDKRLWNIRFKFLADTVAVTEVNKYWQVTKILKTFKLTK